MKTFLKLLALTLAANAFAGTPTLDDQLIAQLKALKASPEVKRDPKRGKDIDAQITEIKNSPCALTTTALCQTLLDSVKGGSADDNYLSATFSSCARHIVPSSISKAPACACLANAFSYTTRKVHLAQTTSFMGFDLSDAEVFARQDKIGQSLALGPKGERMMDLPQVLSDLLLAGGGQLPDGWVSKIPATWKHFEYTSQTVFNPSDSNESSLRRILFFVTNPDYDQWIQITARPTPDAENHQNLIDFIAIQKVDEVSKAKLKNPVIHFRQFWRVFYDDDSVQILRRDQAPSQYAQFDKCISCHPNGMRELSPNPGSYGQDQVDTLLFYQKQMTSYGKVSWGTTLSPTSTDPRVHSPLGPPLGAAEGCVRCHNGLEPVPGHSEYRSAITFETDDNAVTHKLIESMKMPPQFYMDDLWTAVASLDRSLVRTSPDYEGLRQSFEANLNDHRDNIYGPVLDYLQTHGKITSVQQNQLQNLVNSVQSDGNVLLNSYKGHRDAAVKEWLTSQSCGASH